MDGEELLPGGVPGPGGEATVDAAQRAPKPEVEGRALEHGAEGHLRAVWRREARGRWP